MKETTYGDYSVRVHEICKDVEIIDENSRKKITMTFEEFEYLYKFVKHAIDDFNEERK